MKPLLATARTHLRQFAQSDLNDLYELNRDPEVMKYVGRKPLVSIYEAQLDLTRYLSYYVRASKLGVWACTEKESGTLIGLALLKKLEPTEEIEVGYRFHRSYWGKGFATEVCKALVEYGFTQVGLKKIVGITHPDNLASQKVLKKCGLSFERKWLYQQTEINYYSIYKNQFQA
ncbi:GNAT family N-acetyltransferase [Rhodocytophaga rosea]|uniref:GNAT family N-acetyltransferase n=1 Tax=Rhodocytophaga rosea TaxID=2704465 RepID=A0A6C0GKS5_9BACT|nr:GNAT family N-acetyltransferase [Rhodocytophaga rosea]QHT68263.1 GNAT family N-acetyltransferase [Rhodocytophaga rosea]